MSSDGITADAGTVVGQASVYGVEPSVEKSIVTRNGTADASVAVQDDMCCVICMRLTSPNLSTLWTCEPMFWYVYPRSPPHHLSCLSTLSLSLSSLHSYLCVSDSFQPNLFLPLLFLTKMFRFVLSLFRHFLYLSIFFFSRLPERKYYQGHGTIPFMPSTVWEVCSF